MMSDYTDMLRQAQALGLTVVDWREQGGEGE